MVARVASVEASISIFNQHFQPQRRSVGPRSRLESTVLILHFHPFSDSNSLLLKFQWVVARVASAEARRPPPAAEGGSSRGAAGARRPPGARGDPGHTSARNSPRVDPAEIFREPQMLLILIVTTVKLFIAK